MTVAQHEVLGHEVKLCIASPVGTNGMKRPLSLRPIYTYMCLRK